MRHLIPAAALAALLGLSACAQGGPTGLPDNATPETKLTARCEVYTGLMEIAVANKHLMSAETQQTVTVFRNTAGERCENIGGTENPQSALETINAAITRLRQIPAIQQEANQ